MNNSWELLGMTSKWFSLLAMAGVTGGGFSLGLAHLLSFSPLSTLINYISVGAMLGLCMTLLFFLSQVGAINQTGVAGMLDRQMAVILLQSNLGLAVLLRIAGL